MEADRTELNNLGREHAEKVSELKALYEGWATGSGVPPWPIKKPGSSDAGRKRGRGDQSVIQHLLSEIGAQEVRP